MLIFINYYTKFTLLTFMFFLYLQGLREHRALSVNDKNYTPANVAKWPWNLLYIQIGMEVISKQEKEKKDQGLFLKL